MYTKQETSRQRQAFWTTFGQYMQPVLSANGIKTNWINYKTGISGIAFKMDADDIQASIAIVLSHRNDDIRTAHYEQMLQLKTILQETLKEEWEWHPGYLDEDVKTINSVSKTIKGANINRNEDWPTLISFFKPRIIALDEFWSMVKYGFEM
jgi:hypothetical protein